MTGKKKRHPGPPRAKKTRGGNTSSSKKQQPPKKAQPAVSSAETRDDPGSEQRLRTSDEDKKHHQRVLDLFRHAFADALTSPNLTATLQSVKQALYERDFARAFGDPEHLAVYAARWSPTRALCYASVLEGIKEHLEPLSPSLLEGQDSDEDEDEDENENNEEAASTTHGTNPQTLKLISIGGGAAELVALGAFLNNQPAPIPASMTLVDSGPWATVVSQLGTAITTPPPLSKYASAAVKLTNAAMVSPEHFTSTFLQQDALALDKANLASLIGPTPLLITILFTLNELFTTGGIGKTTAFLLNLTAAFPFGSLLLVVDSPGSYSEASIGKEAKRYPMQWLLDRIMLGTRAEPVNGRRWVKVESQDSVWFRLASGGLDYPIPLEDMRYQMHLYRVEDASVEEEDEEEDDD
ncbi:hypothetical protein C8A05DRAFT_33173 [Staphylotrichum tortipilum]|uniref:25S rRNA (Uridine(2843)-N(3))-methyltransferase n=1 Tax=Staphylotrichum tortipilum TaxID=2831512 RepID=A0AAN6RUK9_9PEZI|nr:hypothetical protein C8A05DRAFT_33173 [Staphylotrichum longicolle]